MKGRQLLYSEAELRWIEDRCREPRSRAHAAFCKKFGRSDVSLKNYNALCKRKGWFTGRTGQFAKGQEPHNKGRPCLEGQGGRHPNARRTQFRKGLLPHNTKCAGYERVTVDGYIEISVDETNPHTGFERRFVLKHRWLWEKQYGPLPNDHVLKCIDGNRLNTSPSNWEPIPRALLPRLVRGRHGQGFDYDAAPSELKPAILAVAKLKHLSNKKARDR